MTAPKTHHRTHRQKITAIAAIVARPTFLRLYGLVAGITLLGTTLYWSVLASIVQQFNADQLIDPYLFEHGTTFEQAVFPGQHSFLLKWPIFLLVQLFHSTPLAYAVATVGVSLLTVGALAYMLYRIDRRPVVYGTLFLALAAALLLVPAEAYPGALLPVNMAMLSTRNIEYIVYIVSLIFLIKTPRLLHWQTAVAVATLALLVASDKLFLALSLGGGLLCGLLALITKRRQLVQLTLRWLGVAGVAAGLAFGLLALLGGLHVTGFDTSSGASPYAISLSLKNIILGICYSILGIFTNFGANPAANIVVLKDIPSALFRQVHSPTIISYAINTFIVGLGLVSCWRVVRRAVVSPPVTKKRPKVQQGSDTPQLLSLSLILTTVAAIGVFIASNHYYAVDARYLSIALFAVFTAGASTLRRTKPMPELMVGIGLILTLGMCLGAVTTFRTTNQSLAALSPIEAKNDLIATALTQHKVNTLIGDYWRVVPIKFERSAPQTVLPLSSCLAPRPNLFSRAWQTTATSHSFAYLVTQKASSTGYPGCTTEQIITAYGRPSASQVISGTVVQPEEVLLFYDHGANRPNRHTPATVLPQPIAKLRGITCQGPTTIMNIVAHQDDDILFMNPDLLHAIRQGDCVRSVYLTAGDAGNSKLYWLGREEGSRAAYVSMLGISQPKWVTQTVSLSSTSYVSISKLQSNSQIFLIFLHLPDGNLDGSGFSDTKHQSLQKLITGTIHQISTVDNQSRYTSDELTQALVTLMRTFRPTEIHTQALRSLSTMYPDHSDHIAAANYAKSAYDGYDANHTLPIAYYIGYPVRDKPQNVSGQDLRDKTDTFFTYAEHDNGTCESVASCNAMAYGHYLTRQYQMTN